MSLPLLTDLNSRQHFGDCAGPPVETAGSTPVLPAAAAVRRVMSSWRKRLNVSLQLRIHAEDSGRHIHMAAKRSRRARQLPRRPGLRARMGRVLTELRRVRRSPHPEGVHRLRVAIRRCRSIATIMEEVDGHPGWRKMRALPQKLFRTLGRLRDLQVTETWLKRLLSSDNPVRPNLLAALKQRATGSDRQTVRVARRFDQERWRRLARVLPARVRLVPGGSLTARCLVYERFNELRRLHARAVRTDIPRSWHRLRVGLKRFRYAVESLLPDRSTAWDEGLGHMQTLLGEIRDLDVLTGWIDEQSDGVDPPSAESLRHAIGAERRARIERYCQRMSGDGSLLHQWKAGLPQPKAIAKAASARLRATARAMDPRPQRTAAIAHLALWLFDGLGSSGAEPRFRGDTERVVLRAAAQVHGIRVNGRHTPAHKAARKFLRVAPAPPGWKSHDWELLAEVVRYSRGTEPSSTHNHFAQLSSEYQDRVRGLAGVLRLARGLRRCGVVAAGGIRLDHTAAYVRLRVGHIQDTEENAGRLAAAKHLLEVFLGRPMLIEFMRTSASVSAPMTSGRVGPVSQASDIITPALYERCSSL
jgi:CHAD domain-containing protein